MVSLLLAMVPDILQQLKRECDYITAGYVSQGRRVSHVGSWQNAPKLLPTGQTADLASIRPETTKRLP